MSNSSPLILLSKVGRLDLLRQVYGQVLVPHAVFHEVVTHGAGKPGTVEVASSAWIGVRPLGDNSLAERLAEGLERGEAEAIALAIESGVGLVLMDDQAGRRVALELGLRVVGSVGTLVLAKDRGLLPVVAPLIEQLRTAGLYLSRTARAEILAAAGELGEGEVQQE